MRRLSLAGYPCALDLRFSRGQLRWVFWRVAFSRDQNELETPPTIPPAEAKIDEYFHSLRDILSQAFGTRFEKGNEALLGTGGVEARFRWGRVWVKYNEHYPWDGTLPVISGLEYAEVAPDARRIDWNRDWSLPAFSPAYVVGAMLLIGLIVRANALYFRLASKAAWATRHIGVVTLTPIPPPARANTRANVASGFRSENSIAFATSAGRTCVTTWEALVAGQSQSTRSAAALMAIVLRLRRVTTSGWPRPERTKLAPAGV